jgi:hypothetical protein
MWHNPNDTTPSKCRANHSSSKHQATEPLTVDIAVIRVMSPSFSLLM